MSLKDLILSAEDRPLTKMSVPEWGTDVYLRPMSGIAREKWEGVALAGGKVNPDKFRARLLVLCLCDDQGNLIFGESDVGPLSEKNTAVLSRLFQKAQFINGLTKEDVDELTKNSLSDPKGSST